MFTTGRGRVLRSHTLVAYRAVVGAVQLAVALVFTKVSTRGAVLLHTFAHGVGSHGC